jgi:hypothetical protein
MKLFFKAFALCLLIPFIVLAKNDLSICSIFKNEGPFLKEWIEFHKIQGVKHFYLYNNNSDDNYKKVLKPYIKSKEVTLVDWLFTFEKGKTNDWLNIQTGAYQDCLNRFGGDNEWIAFIDADEFLYCIDGTSIPIFLTKYKEFGGLCVNWLLFGTSHVETVPKKKLMIEVLTMCSKRENPRNRRIKSIIQPEKTEQCVSAHAFKYKEGFVAVGSDLSVITGGNSKKALHDLICINHYWTRTEKCFRERKVKSRKERRNEENEKNLQVWADSYNQSSDTNILQFVPQLRKNMGFK